jgi:hypothetical protein
VRISIVIPTTWRNSLVDAVLSAYHREVQTIVVIDGDAMAVNPKMIGKFAHAHPLIASTGKRNDDYGATARNVGVQLAEGEYVMFLDDDDVYLPWALDKVLERIGESQKDEVLVFSMKYASTKDVVERLRGTVLWKDEVLRQSEVGTPMLAIPLYMALKTRWHPGYGHDHQYARELGQIAKFRWFRDVIVEVRHTPEDGGKNV